MTTIIFDQDLKLHQDLFENFKNDLLSFIHNKDHLLAQYENHVDQINILLEEIAVEDLGYDDDILEADNYWQAAIYDKRPTSFGIIAGIEYIDYMTEEPTIEYIKASGEIWIKDNKIIIWRIDTASIDYSNQSEFDRTRHTYKFKR